MVIPDINEFDFYLRFAKPLVLSLSKPDERILAAAWVQKLRDPNSGEEKLRVDYLKLLLFVLQRKRLARPFTENPNSYETLERFPEGFQLIDVAKALIQAEEQERRKRLGGPSGDNPPFSTDYSADFLEYTAVQDIPKFGVHAYYAISKDPLPFWDYADRGIFPKTAFSAVAFGTQPISGVSISLSTPSVSKSRSKSPESRSKSRKRSSSESSRGKSPPTSPFGGDAFPEDRIPPSWGSNLVTVTEPPKEASEIEETPRRIPSPSRSPRAYSPQLPQIDEYEDWTAVTPPSFHEPPPLYAYADDVLPERPEVVTLMRRGVREYSPPAQFQPTPLQLQTIEEPAILRQELNLPTYDADKIRANIMAHRKRMAQKKPSKKPSRGVVKKTSKSKQVVKKTSSTMGPKGRTIQEATSATEVEMVTVEPTPASRIPAPGSKPSSRAMGSKLPARAGTKLPVPAQKQKASKKVQITMSAAEDFPGIGDLSAASLPYRTPSPRPSGIPPQLAVASPMYDAEELSQYGIQPGDLRNVDFNVNIEGGIEAPPDFAYDEVSAEMDAWDQRMTQIEAENAPSLPYLTPPLPTQYSPQLPSGSAPDEWFAESPPSYYEPLMLHEDYALRQDELPEMPAMVEASTRRSREYSPIRTPEFVRPSIQPIPEPSCLTDTLELPKYDIEKMRKAVEAFKKKQAGKVAKKIGKPGTVKTRIQKKTSKSVTTEETTTQTGIPCPASSSRIPQPGSRIPCPGARPSGSRTAVCGSKIPMRGSKLPRARQKPPPKMEKLIAQAAPEYPDIGDLSAASLPYRTPSPRRPPVASPAPSLPYRTPSPRRGIEPPMYDMEELQQYGLDPEDLRDVELDFAIKEEEFVMPPDSSYQEVQQDEIDEETKPSSQAAQSIIDEANRQLKAVDDLLQEKLNKVTKHRKPFMGLQDVSGEFETGDDMEWQEAEEFFAEKKEPSPYKPTRQPLQEIFPGVSFDAGFDFLEDEDAGILVEMDYDEIESEAQPKPLSPTRSIKDLVQEIMEQVSSTVPPADVGVAVTTPRRSPTPRRVSPGLFGETPPQLASPVDRFTAQELAEMQYAELLSPEARRPSPRTPPRRRATWSGSPPSPVRRTFTPTGPRIATPRTPEFVDPFGDVDDIGVSPIRPPSTVFGWTTPEKLKKPRPETISPPIAVDTVSPLIEEEFPEEYYEELLFPESPESPGIIEYDYDLTPEDLDVDIGELLKSPEIQQGSPSIQTILERYEYTDGFFDRERPYTSGYIQSGNSRIKLQRRAPIPMMSPIQEDLEAFETPPRGQASVQPGYRSPQPRIPSPVVEAQPQLSEEDRRFIEHYIPPERQELMKRVSALVADVPYHQIPDWIPPPPDSPVFAPFQDTTEGLDFGVISPPPEFADFEEPEDLPFDDFEQMEAFVAGLSYDIVEAEPLPEDASFIQPELVGSPVSPFTIDSGVGGDFLVEETPIQFPRSPPATPPRRQPRMEPRRQPSPESPYEDPMEMWLDLIEDCMMQSLTPPKKDVFQAGVRRVQRHPERKVMSPVMEVPPDYQEEYLPFRRQVWKATGKMEKRPIQLQRGVLRPKAKPGLPTLSEHIDYPESPVRAGVSPERPFETRRERMDRMRGRAQRRRLDFDGMVSPDRRQPAVYGPRLEYFEATPLTPPSPHTRILQELQPLPEQPWPQQLMGEARLGVFEAQQTILDEALPENLPSPIQTYTHVHGWRTPEKFKVQAEPLPDFNIYMPTDATPLYEETFEELVEEEEEQYSPIGTEKPGFGIDEEFPDLDQYTPPPQTVPQRYPSPIPGPSWRTPQPPPSPRTPQRYPSPIPGPSWRTPQPPPSPRTPQRYPSPIPGPSWRTPQPPPSPSPSPRTPSPFLRSTSPRTPPCTPVRQKPPEDIFRKVSQTVIGIEQFSPPGMMAPPGSPPTPMSYPEAMQEMINVLTTGEYEVPPRRRPTILYGHNERKPIWVQRHPVRPQLSPVPDDRAEPPDGHVYWPGPHVPNVVKPSRPVLSPNRLHPMRQRSPLYANTPPSSAKRRSPELPAYWADAAELYHLMPVNVRRPPQAYPPDEEVTPQKPSRPREERRRRAKPRRLGFDEPPRESREVQVQVQEELSEINVTLSPRSPIYTVSKFDELPPSPERRRVPPPQTIPMEPWSPPSPPLVVPRPPRFSPPPRDPRLPTVVSPQRVGAVSPPEGYYSPPPSPVPPTPPTPPSPPTPPGSPAQLERLRRNIEKHQYTDQRYDTMREMMMAAQVFSGGKQIPVRLRSQKPSYKLGRIEEVSPGLERYPSPPRRVIEGELLPISPPTPVRTPTAEERAAMQYEMLIRTPPRRYDSDRPILDQLDVEAAKFQPSLIQNQQYAWAWESPTRERPVTLPTAPVYHDIDVSPPHLYGSPTEEVLPSPPDFPFEVDVGDTLDVSPIQYYSPEAVSPQSLPSPYRSYTPPLYQPPAASPPRSPSFIRRVREHQYTEQFFDRARPGATKTVQSGKRNVNLHQRYVPPDLGAIEELRERPILESPGGLRPPIYATGAPRSAEKISPEDLFPEAVRLVARRPRSPPGAVKDVTPTKTPTRISEGGRRVPMSKRLGPTAKVRRKLHMEDDGEGVFVHTEFRSPEKLPSPRTPPRAVWSPPSVGGTPSRTPKARSPGVTPRRSPSHRTPQSTVTKVTSKETFIRYLPSPNLSPSDYETYEVSPPFGGRTSPGPGSPINEAMTTSFIAEEMEDFQWMG